MRFFDFFAGIGGFRLGMEMAGHECVGHCEIDKYAHKSYVAMHQPKESEVFFKDVRTIKPELMPECECYCFGFPCQAFSISGKRRGFDDARGTLFFEVMRIAKERKPEILFAENVAGLLNHEGGSLLGSSYPLWQNWGILANGKCLTAKTSVFRNTDKGCSLSDILEESVDERYFLSQKTVDRLLNYKDTEVITE